MSPMQLQHREGIPRSHSEPLDMDSSFASLMMSSVEDIHVPLKGGQVYAHPTDFNSSQGSLVSAITLDNFSPHGLRRRLSLNNSSHHSSTNRPPPSIRSKWSSSLNSTNHSKDSSTLTMSPTNHKSNNKSRRKPPMKPQRDSSIRSTFEAGQQVPDRGLSQPVRSNSNRGDEVFALSPVQRKSEFTTESASDCYDGGQPDSLEPAFSTAQLLEALPQAPIVEETETQLWLNSSLTGGRKRRNGRRKTTGDIKLKAATSGQTTESMAAQKQKKKDQKRRMSKSTKNKYASRILSTNWKSPFESSRSQGLALETPKKSKNKQMVDVDDDVEEEDLKFGSSPGHAAPPKLPSRKLSTDPSISMFDEDDSDDNDNDIRDKPKLRKKKGKLNMSKEIVLNQPREDVQNDDEESEIPLNDAIDNSVAAAPPRLPRRINSLESKTQQTQQQQAIERKKHTPYRHTDESDSNNDDSMASLDDLQPLKRAGSSDRQLLGNKKAQNAEGEAIRTRPRFSTGSQTVSSHNSVSASKTDQKQAGHAAEVLKSPSGRRISNKLLKRLVSKNGNS